MPTIFAPNIGMERWLEVDILELWEAAEYLPQGSWVNVPVVLLNGEKVGDDAYAEQFTRSLSSVRWEVAGIEP